MTTAAQLDDRYGRTGNTRRRRIAWISAVAIAALVVGWFGWSIVASNMNAVRADGVGMQVVDAHEVEVSFEVSGPRDRAYACAIEALDEQFGVVGWRVVEIPASDTHTRSFTETVPTVAAATTGLVNSCWVI